MSELPRTKKSSRSGSFHFRARVPAFGIVSRVRELSRVTLQVFLDAHPQTGDNIKMITDEVSQIQEVSRTGKLALGGRGGVFRTFTPRRKQHSALLCLSTGEILLKVSQRADGSQAEQ